MLSNNQQLEAENEAERLFKKNKSVSESKFLGMSAAAFPSIQKICMAQHDAMQKHYLYLQSQPKTKRAKNEPIFSKIR